MTICFICGSLEPGRDGVGDYTRKLAAELIQQGHKVCIIALHDRFCNRVWKGEQLCEGSPINVLRIPYGTSKQDIKKKAKEFLAGNSPTWLSLQFVPFSFHIKGVPIELYKVLHLIDNNYMWHFMFHELWVGMEKGATLKYQIWAKVQKVIIKQLIRRTKPKVIHTQTHLYQLQLLKLGFHSKKLPLFSNITFHKIKKTQTVFNKEKNDKRISLVVFGTIHPGAPIEEFAKEASSYCRERGISICLTLVGRTGEEEKHWSRIWMSNDLEIVNKGEQAEEEVSKILQSSTIGITTNPIALVEKSGTVAAMLAHGLPVISLSKPWIPKIKLKNKLKDIIEYSPGRIADCFRTKKASSYDTSISQIANRLVLDLQTSSAY